MRRKKVLLLLVLVLVLAMSSGVCQGVKAETVEVPATEGPQYGGTLTLVSASMSSGDPPGWDIHESPSIKAAFWLSPVEEYLFGGDVLNKGARGTGEAGFNLRQAELPSDMIIGNVCESYELSEDGLVAKLHVRPGIMWQANDNIAMAAREVTADDVAYMLNRYRSSSKASKLSDFADENFASVIDKHTVELQFSTPFASWLWLIGYGLYCNLYPQEMVNAGPDDWEHVTGTGPFAITDYVTGSQVVYAKNNHWWNKMQTVDGVTYETPFIDTLVYPIMPDEGTRLAALIAGRVDIMTNVPLIYRDVLETSVPGLNIVEGASGDAITISFNCLNGPSSNIEFRRALMLGTDQQAIADAILGSRVGGFPFSYALGESVYTPVDKMDEDAAKLYTYDPATAMQQIADLGYASATISIAYQTTEQNFVTAAEILEDQWSKLGLHVDLKPVDPAVFAGYYTGDGSGWSGALITTGANSRTARGIENSRSKPYLSVYTDQYFNDEMTAMMAESDGIKRDAMIKEAAMYFIGQVNELALVESSTLTCWWPWVKNYYGETEAGCNNFNPMISTLWIDQDLKAEMGY